MREHEFKSGFSGMLLSLFLGLAQLPMAAAFPEWSVPGPSSGYAYGEFNVDLSGVPSGADVSKYAKVANDWAASADAAGQMPRFQVTLERRADGSGAWASPQGGIQNLDQKFTDVLGGYLVVRLDTVAAGSFGRLYGFRFRMPGGGSAGGAPPAQERIRIGIRNSASASRTYFGAAGDIEDETRVGRIKAVTGSWDPKTGARFDFGTVSAVTPASSVPAKELRLVNVGTGKLTLHSISGSNHAAFAWSTALPTNVLEPLGPAVGIAIRFDPAHSSNQGTPGTKEARLSIANSSGNLSELKAIFSATLTCADSHAKKCGCEEKGVYGCNGVCSEKPAPPDYGKTCNQCGTINCQGTCNDCNLATHRCSGKKCVRRPTCLELCGTQMDACPESCREAGIPNCHQYCAQELSECQAACP